MINPFVILLNYHHSKGYYTVPYDSTSGMPVIFGPISIAIILYLVLRVWWEIRKDKMKKPPKNN
jgi:hypothetical protein